MKCKFGFLFAAICILLSSTALGKEALSGSGLDRGAFFALSVRDMDAMIDWYSGQLGFNVENKGGNSQRKGALLSKENILIELGQFGSATSLDKLKSGIESHEVHGIFKIGFLVSDIEGMFAKVKSQKINIFFPVVKSSGKYRTFAVKDPEGNIVQFFGE